MQIAINTLYQHTDSHGDTVRVEQIGNRDDLIITICKAGDDETVGTSVQLNQSQTTQLTTILRAHANRVAEELIKGAMNGQ